MELCHVQVKGEFFLFVVAAVDLITSVPYFKGEFFFKLNLLNFYRDDGLNVIVELESGKTDQCQLPMHCILTAYWVMPLHLDTPTILQYHH